MLPTEAQLTARFGVSRTVIREALARLQRIGLIQARQGLGTIVQDRDQWRELDPELLAVRVSSQLIQDLVPDLLSVRRAVEVEAAGLAALNRRDCHLKRLAELVEEMHKIGLSPEEQTKVDIDFHEALLVASGNKLICELMRPINTLRRIGSIITTSSDPSIIPTSIAGHERIFKAVEAGDEAGAREAMAQHLGQHERELSVAMSLTKE